MKSLRHNVAARTDRDSALILGVKCLGNHPLRPVCHAGKFGTYDDPTVPAMPRSFEQSEVRIAKLTTRLVLEGY